MYVSSFLMVRDKHEREGNMYVSSFLMVRDCTFYISLLLENPSQEHGVRQDHPA